MQASQVSLFRILMIILVGLVWCVPGSATTAEEWEHGHVQSGEVKIHYVTAGKGPLVVLIHGFPDYWYSWRKQIPALAKKFQVVAIDQRGYNKSDQPEGVENYRLPLLAQDVLNVVKHFKQDQAVLVGHDWGGYVAWTCAMMYPQMVERLIILNAPHPACLGRELSQNKEQQKNSQYARDFQKKDAAEKLTPEGLAGWVTDEEAKQSYIKAFKRSSFDGMLNFYKANYPKTSTSDDTKPQTSPTYPKIKCRVLMIHGLDDTALMPAALNDSWQWMEQDLTIITVPGAGHFVQQDAAKLVTDRIIRWLR